MTRPHRSSEPSLRPPRPHGSQLCSAPLAAAVGAHVQVWGLFGTRLGCCRAKGISQACLLNTDSVLSVMPGAVDEKKTCHVCMTLAFDRAGGDAQGKPGQSGADCRMSRGAGPAGAQGEGPGKGPGVGGSTSSCPGSRVPAAVCPWASHLTSLSLRIGISPILQMRKLGPEK